MATSPQSPPKRPRLSLQIKALANGPSGRTSRCLAAAVDVKSPTSFNTLSNVYATAVDRSTPVQENPPTAFLGRKPVLRLQTQDVVAKNPVTSTNTPYLGPYLDTPVTAQPMSPAVAKQICFPSAMTATPPLSAQPPEQNGARVFTFDSTTPATAVPPGTRAPSQPQATQNPKRRTTMPAGGTKLPYTHPRSLRSILRNSPLPPLSTKSPESPRRQSLRLQEKAARRVAYNSPLTQEITTSMYVKSHIDLLAEDATPISPSCSSSDDNDSLLDQAMADADTRDGGQTPGPFEEMRRRMANMHASTPMALSPTGGGIRKRGGKRREKKRRWVWTIGQDEDAENGEEVGTPTTAIENTPIAPSVPVIAVPAPRPRTRNQQAQAQMAKAVAAATATQSQTQPQPQPQAQVPLLAVPTPPTRAAPQQQQQQPHALRNELLHQPHQYQQPQEQQQTRELTPIPAFLLPTRASTPDSSSCANSIRHITPEPTPPSSLSLALSSLNNNENCGHGRAVVVTTVEPPTPSMESTTSTVSVSSLHSNRDSVFEGENGGGGDGVGGDDVEMSDAGSFTSFEDDGDCREDGGDGGGKREVEFGLGLGLGGLGGFIGGDGNDGDVDMDEGTPTMTARPVSARDGFGRGWAPWRDGVVS